MRHGLSTIVQKRCTAGIMSMTIISVDHPFSEMTHEFIRFLYKYAVASKYRHQCNKRKLVNLVLK